MSIKAHPKDPVAAGDAPKSPPRGPSHRALIGAVAAIVAAAGLFYGIKRWEFFVVHEETDDAQVEGHISPVLPRVSGYVARVLVNDNDRVVAGQPLVEIQTD